MAYARSFEPVRAYTRVRAYARKYARTRQDLTLSTLSTLLSTLSIYLTRWQTITRVAMSPYARNTRVRAYARTRVEPRMPTLPPVSGHLELDPAQNTESGLVLTQRHFSIGLNPKPYTSVHFDSPQDASGYQYIWPFLRSMLIWDLL